MWLHTLLFMTIAVLGLAEDPVPMPACASKSTTNSHGCTLTYSPYVTPQVAPTSTVYNAIVTTYYYAVDCHFCTVTNAPNHNFAPEGHFTTRTTVDALTISRVACIPQFEATTRGVDPTTTSRPILGEQQNDEFVVPRTQSSHGLEDDSKAYLTPRSETGALFNLAMDFSNDIPPDTQQLPGKAQQLLTSIWSAMFALNIADSGLNTTWACAQVQTIEVRYQLKESWLDPDQVKGLVCWISEHGYFFNTTRAELYSTLQAAIYALQVAGDFTRNRTAICDDLDLFYRIGGYLGINTKGFEEYACSHLPSETPSPSGEYGPTPVIPLIPYPINSTTSWGHPTPWNPNTTIWPTGTQTRGHPTSFPNITSWPATGNSHNPTNVSWPHPTGTGNSSSNITWSHPTGTSSSTHTGNLTSFLPTDTRVSNSTSSYPTATASGTGVVSGTAATSGLPIGTFGLNETQPLHIPLDPHAKAFYPAVETPKPPRSGWYKRY